MGFVKREPLDTNDVSEETRCDTPLPSTDTISRLIESWAPFLRLLAKIFWEEVSILGQFTHALVDEALPGLVLYLGFLKLGRFELIRINLKPETFERLQNLKLHDFDECNHFGDFL